MTNARRVGTAEGWSESGIESSQCVSASAQASAKKSLIESTESKSTEKRTPTLNLGLTKNRGCRPTQHRNFTSYYMHKHGTCFLIFIGWLSCDKKLIGNEGN